MKYKVIKIVHNEDQIELGIYDTIEQVYNRIGEEMDSIPPIYHEYVDIIIEEIK